VIGHTKPRKMAATVAAAADTDLTSLVSGLKSTSAVDAPDLLLDAAPTLAAAEEEPDPDPAPAPAPPTERGPEAAAASVADWPEAVSSVTGNTSNTSDSERRCVLVLEQTNPSQEVAHRCFQVQKAQFATNDLLLLIVKDQRLSRKSAHRQARRSGSCPY
jgi:hypothetical protein